MAGGKKNKKAVAHTPEPSSQHGLDDSELVDDLLSQLDARDAAVPQESANSNEMKTEQDQKIQNIRSKASSKDRYKAREVSASIMSVRPL